MPRTPVHGPVIIPNCLEVSLLWSDGGRAWRNTLHGNLTAVGPVNPTMAETLFSGFKTQLTSSGFGADLATTTSFTGVSIKDLRNGNNPEFRSSGAAAAGTGVGSSSAVSNALVVTLRTAQAGRAFRGRVYLAGLINSLLTTPTTWSGPAGTNAKAFIDGVNSVMNTNQVPLVIAQRALNAGTDIHGNPLPTRAAAVVVVTSTDIANPRVDTQRRRLGR